MMQEKREMLNIAAILTVSMSSRCRQLISAIIIATVSTSGAAARRGCPQRARLMFRTVSEIRARIGRCFISTNASASVNEADASIATLWGSGGGRREGFHRFLGPSCRVLEGSMSRRVISRALYWDPLPEKERRYARPI